MIYLTTLLCKTMFIMLSAYKFLFIEDADFVTYNVLISYVMKSEP